MGQLVLDGDPPVDIRLKRHARARRLSLRVSRRDGAVSMTVPHGTRTAEALAFAREKESWIRDQLRRAHAPAVPAIGGELLFEGRALPIVAGSGRAARLENGAIAVPERPDLVPRRIAALLKTLARDRLAEASDRHARALGVSFGTLVLRDTRSRWGSCSSDGRLMYSWRLVMAPPQVLDYVAAHEVAHLREMNHSPAFWAQVAGIFPDYQAARAWLRRNGALLHAYRFRD